MEWSGTTQKLRIRYKVVISSLNLKLVGDTIMSFTYILN